MRRLDDAEFYASTDTCAIDGENIFFRRRIRIRCGRRSRAYDNAGNVFAAG
ncbi:MAG: hypothetical protein ACLUNO_08195 [Oscillospiraceae bacterium]